MISKTTRRQFLGTCAGALSAPMLIPAFAIGQAGATPASERVTLACIGVGGMGTGNLRNFLQDDRVQVVAVCDVDEQHLNRAGEIAGLDASSRYGDFREVIRRRDIDAVMIATPDHWHSLITVAAARAGKDIYCEKPLAASVWEGRVVSDVVRARGRVLQCGTWRRSGQHTRKACELVRNGYIGQLKSIEVGVPAQFAIRGGYTGLEPSTAPPAHLDYQMWQGSAPKAPYRAGRVHFNFRWIDDYAHGYITDWGAHFLDVAQWGNGSDDTTPVEIAARDVGRRDKGYYDAPEQYVIDYHYANGVRMSMIATQDAKKWGVKFIGSEGWVFTENERLETYPEKLLRIRIKEDEVRLNVSNNHHRNFIDCVKSRGATAASVEASHRAATCCYLGAITVAVGRPLRFNPKNELFLKDEAANRLLSRTMRAPWKLKA